MGRTRRRLRIWPVQDGEAPVYQNWLASRNLPAATQQQLHRLFVNLNNEIGKRLTTDFQVGHSYFMRDDIHTELGLQRVWKHAVTPLLREYFHSTRNADTVLAEFTILRLLGLPDGAEPDRAEKSASCLHEECASGTLPA
jgi:hypothetical protein